jgi:hypothetical protein
MASCNTHMTSVKGKPNYTTHMTKYHYCSEITGTFLFKLYI